MPESSPYTNEMIDSAWQEALDTNSAFDRYKTAETRLQRVREVASLAIDGITIADEVIPNLENDLADAQIKLNSYMHASSPLMKVPNSPFRAGITFAEQYPHTIEELIGIDSPICDIDELCAFAEIRGYNKGVGSQVFNILAREGRGIKVNVLSDYTPQTDTTAEDFGELRTITRDAGRVTEVSLDKVGILYNTSQWVNAKPNIRHLGVTFISFLADYCNHAFPGLKRKLPVTHPPKLKPDAAAQAAAESARLKELDPRDLLLDKVDLDGEGLVEVVTDHSLRRHALSLGYTQLTAPQYAKLVNSIKEAIAPDEYPGKSVYAPYRINDQLIFTGKHSKGTSWGIPPDALEL